MRDSSIRALWILQIAIMASSSVGCGKIADKFKKFQTELEKKENEKEEEEERTVTICRWRPSANPSFFSTCAELKEYVQVVCESTPKTQIATEYSGFLPHKPTTYRPQTSDFQDQDMAQISADQIFVSRPHDILVIDRVGHNEIGAIPLSPNTRKTDLYTTTDKLILLESTYSSVTAQTFKLIKGQLPMLEKTISFGGSLVESRLIQNRLVITTNLSVGLANIGETTLTHTPGTEASIKTLANIPCHRITKPISSPSSRQGAINLHGIYEFPINTVKGPTPIRSLALTLDFPVQYINHRQIILGEGIDTATNLIQIPLGNGSSDLNIGAISTIEGRLQDHSSIHAGELNEPVFVAMTRNQFNSSHKPSIDFYSLRSQGSNFVEDSVLEGIGSPATLRNISFHGTKSYLGTNDISNPLYTIDLSDPRHLTLVGEPTTSASLEVLHSLDSQRLLGLGKSSAGTLHLSLFTAQESAPLQLTDHQQMGELGVSSDALEDYHAIFFSRNEAEDKSVLALTIVDPGHYKYAGDPPRSGALFFHLTDDKIVDQKLITHQDLITAACAEMSDYQPWQFSSGRFDVQRILQLDGQIVTISPFGIKWIDPESFDVKASTAFTNGKDTCQKIMRSRYMECTVKTLPDADR